MKLWRPSGALAVMTTANHMITVATKVAIPQINSQMKRGIASSRRKKTVRRLRSSSSSIRSRIGR